MKQDASIELFRYWDRLRNGRPAPKRTDIEPADIKRLLADTFILEKDGRGEAVFRLAGTRLCAIHGRELKGYSLALLWAEHDQRMVGRLAQDAFHEKAVIVLDYEGSSGTGRSTAFEMLLLPLDGGLENPRCLGIASAVEKQFWLGAEPVVENRIDSVRVIDPDREPLFLKNRPSVPVPPLAPAASALGAVPRPAGSGRRFRHLVVFEGGRGK